jgi:hypothetical protein
MPYKPEQDGTSIFVIYHPEWQKFNLHFFPDLVRQSFENKQPGIAGLFVEIYRDRLP